VQPSSAQPSASSAAGDGALKAQRLGHLASGTHPDRSTRRPLDFLAPRTGSDDEQNHHDDDGNDEGGDGDRAGAHGVSEPVGISWRPYSVSPIVFRRSLLAA
jgi:hypothetical protein